MTTDREIMTTKERPILFSAPMVRSILDGSKTQTRRLVKRRHDTEEIYPVGFHDAMFWFADGDVLEIPCPYGVTGDRLWVRESIESSDGHDSPIMYSADRIIDYSTNWCWKRLKLPSIHMPRGMSRITLEITEIRVQRLREISEDDAKAEGADIEEWQVITHVGAFHLLWDSINAKRAPWSSNPWVWAVTFRRIES